MQEINTREHVWHLTTFALIALVSGGLLYIMTMADMPLLARVPAFLLFGISIVSAVAGFFLRIVKVVEEVAFREEE